MVSSVCICVCGGILAKQKTLDRATEPYDSQVHLQVNIQTYLVAQYIPKYSQLTIPLKYV